VTDDKFEAALREATTAARDLVRASARLTRRILEKADRAAKDPKGSATRAAKRAAKELESASHEIDQLLKKL